jgi:hypothetical protein
MSRSLVLIAAFAILFASAASAQTQLAAAPAAEAAPSATAGEPVPRALRAQARRDCYAENIALSGEDLRGAMRSCLQERFPGVKLYASNGLTRDGRPTAQTARALCREEADRAGLAGAERRAALVACFGEKRPDLAARAECRKQARGKGLGGEALREAIAACGRAPQG